MEELQNNLQAQIANNGGFLHFTGHSGKLHSEIVEFDLNGFEHHEQVELNALLIDAINCQSEILKQNSLFITDLSVVEDPARTYNVVTGTGNHTGVWTFGNLIKNMANQTATGVSARTLLKEWIRGWTNGRTINGQTVPLRIAVYNYLIIPWLVKANNWQGNHYQNLNIVTQWETDWDNTSEANLLKYAPFKLMAIVNRLDLKGNTGYSSSITNAGETRFIYTLIAPHTNTR
ncbi:MAG TPA: hypothetical protein PL009_12965 [Flavipsychrobacter sp.]|nr:hypothetical protein [Flavipsychrobacter sp.]